MARFESKEIRVRLAESRYDSHNGQGYNPKSTSAGQEVRKAVTVVETPQCMYLPLRLPYDTLWETDCRRDWVMFRRRAD